MGMGQVIDIDQVLSDYILQSQKAAPLGVATLDSNTKIPKAQIDLIASDVGAIATGGTAATANQLTTPRTISTTGDATYSVSFDGSSNVSSGLTLATVNSNTGSFGSASSIPTVTVNGKGQITAISSNSIGNELIALQALADTVGFLRKTGDGVYSIDVTTYQPSDSDLTTIAALAQSNKSVIFSNGTAWTAKQIDISTDITGILPGANGGTGNSTYTNNAVIFANSSGSGFLSSSNLIWNNNTGQKCLGIGGTPGTGIKLDVSGITRTQSLNVTDSTVSTSTTTGASVIGGGQGVQGNQYVGGFSSLGGDANHPGIKVKVLTGTTAATEGGTTNVAHGLTASTIISVSVIVFWSAGNFVNPCHTSTPGFYFDVSGGTDVIISNHPTESQNILSKTIKIAIIYKE